MAMSVMHNSAAALSLGELNKNVNKVGKLLGKVSSGMKINSAQDDASSFAISEKMREQIRSLLQDNQNVQNGASLLRTAEGGIDEIVNELRRLKELAINSANDHNTDKDRETIQKEFNQRMANINDIATETNYNGIPLLYGTWGKNIREIENAPTVIPAGNFTIETDGVYILSKGYTGRVNVDAKNVKILQEDPSTALNNVEILCSSEGNKNLWIDSLNITNTTDKSIIKFQGSENVLTFKGNNILRQDNANFSSAVIHVGNGTTFEGDDGGKLTVDCMGLTKTSTAIGIDDTGRRAATPNPEDHRVDSYININSGTYEINVEYGGGGIGMADNAYFVGDIKISGGDLKINVNEGSGIGAGSGLMKGDIIIGEANIEVTSVNGAGIGSGGYGNRADLGDWVDGNIIIGDGANIKASSTFGAGIGAGEEYGVSFPENVIIQNLIVSSQANVSSTGYNGFYNENTVEKPLCDGRYGIVRNVTKESGIEVEQIFGNQINPSAEKITKFNPLVIHHGTKANQNVKFYINDMHTKSLKGEIPNEADTERLKNLKGTAKTDYKNLLKEAKDLTLDDVNVKTKHGANVAVRVIDGAIDYALDESTRMGSYIQRLEYTDSNITTMNENIQGAESAIRDADMAREMTEYTKYNILTQSSQAMLAQACDK